MNLSADFITLLHEQLGEESQMLLEALETPSPCSVRINPLKPANSIAGHTLEDLLPVPWCPDAYYLPNRPQFTLDPALHQGRYYVQEASSMLLWQALEQHVSRFARVMDVCAAPGGKSTLTAAYLNEEGCLLSNEPIHPRDYILLENCTKWGHLNHQVCSQYPQQFGRGLHEQFDCLIVDAPCSGEGMFRKEKKAIEDWSMKNVQDCVSRQQEILDAVIPLLKPNGILIYSTCTYNRHEDEEQVNWLLQEHDMQALPLQLDPTWGICGSEMGYHCYPHRVQGEGFFLAVLRKSEGEACNVQPWEKLMRCVRLLQADEQQIKICQNQYLQEFPHWEVDRETALQYLRQEALRIDMQETPRGLVVLTYEQQPLGFVKHIGSRQNNLYPKEWRIRHL